MAGVLGWLLCVSVAYITLALVHGSGLILFSFISRPDRKKAVAYINGCLACAAILSALKSLIAFVSLRRVCKLEVVHAGARGGVKCT